MANDHIHFVTGRLAEPLLRQAVAPLAAQQGFDYSIGVLPITVAALMTPDWIARRVAPPSAATRVMVPGYCHGDLQSIAAATQLPVERGPKDLRELPQYFGRPPHVDYGNYDIQIIAEINHAPRRTLDEVLRQADQLQASGADIIDVGCDPGGAWTSVGECVRALRDAGHRVSIDSFQPDEISAAAQAGAELVLSVNASNRQAAADWGCEVVVVPDVPGTMDGLEASMNHLDRAGVRYRIDPVLEPIGFGFLASLLRYVEARRRWPQAEMLMGIGNLTELTDVDSAGVNVLLLAICQELQIRSVLTTEVISWARSSVRECDLARRLSHYAVKERALPKHIEPRLVMLRDPRVMAPTPEEIAQLASQIKDHNVRLFLAEGAFHAATAGQHLTADDVFVLFEKLLAASPKAIDASHAFYLGYELSKAVTARTLGKNYRQDEALTWGMLTEEETSHRARRDQEQGP